MKRTGIHSTDAKRYVRIAQFAGVGLGVLAAALWVMDIPGLSRALPQKPPARDGLDTEPMVTQVALVPKFEPESPAAIMERLELTQKRQPPPVGGTAPPPPPPPLVTDSGPAWRYLGEIRESTRTLALVSIDSTQKFVAEGAAVTQTTLGAEGRPDIIYKATVTEIEPDFIEIEESGSKRRHIDLDARTARVSWVKNMQMASAGTPMPNSGGLSLEARQRMAGQGMDPAAVERSRQAAANALGGAGRNRGIPNSPGSQGQAIQGGNAIIGGVATPDKTPAVDAAGNKTGAQNPAGVGKKKRPDAETAN